MNGLPQPLAGRRILVTRTRERAEGLVDSLHAAGASVAVVPLITTVPIADPEAISRVAAEVGAAPAPRWVAFTSATAVRLVLGAAGAPALTGMSIAAVGPATADALEALGAPADLVAVNHDAAGLAAAMLDHGLNGANVWFPAAEGARGTLVEALREAGAVVTVQQIYRSVMPASAPERLRAALGGGIDAITLTSGSTARNLAEAAGTDGLPAGVMIVCIGEQTADIARSAGLTVDAVARTPSIESLVAALTECLTPQPLR
ncbi:MAG TPA: uroporphyrinogen-III synthase [Candidatus Dormibacteraeota bacterium]|nr:uroporphyrinogen-III synthase [Candidatus Dormibacteraeota bacterium]